MKKFQLAAALTAVLSAASIAQAQTTTWQIRPRPLQCPILRPPSCSMLQRPRRNSIKVTGTVNLDDQDISKSTVNASIDVAS